MLSLRFGLRPLIDETNVASKCLFCRDKNFFCSSSWKYKLHTKTSLQELNLEGLPECLLLHIFLFLDLKDLMIIRMVSRAWKRIAEDKQLWKTTNLSCKRIAENSWIFLLPKLVKRHIRVMNLMWSSFSVPAFRNLLKSFPNVEVLLLQNCRFSNGGHENASISNSKQVIVENKHLPMNLTILDLRNIQDRWFEEYNFGFEFMKIQAVAFSHSLPNNWLSIMTDSWLPNLKILHIQNNSCVTERFMEKIISNSTSLESINVQGCMYINGSFLLNATDKLPLKHLDMNSTRLEGAYLLSAKWRNIELRSLNISFCCKVSSYDLKNLYPKLFQLKHLQCSFVGWGKALNDDVIYAVTKNNVLQVECLDLQSTFAMSAKALSYLCRKCPHLKNLRLGNVMKTESELNEFLDSIPSMEELSLQIGGSNFSAVHLFNSIAQKCPNLRSIFLYNIQFDVNPETKIQESILQLFVSLKHLRNFFIGGYPHREKSRVEGLISKIANTLNLKINFKRPKRIIPLHDGCFDQFLARFISAPYYNAVNLRRALQQTHNCESFYQTGLQKLNNFEFPLVRS